MDRWEMVKPAEQDRRCADCGTYLPGNAWKRRKDIATQAAVVVCRSRMTCSWNRREAAEREKRDHALRFPEHTKLDAVKARTQAVGEFIEWAVEQGIALGRFHHHTADCVGASGLRYCDMRDGDLVPVQSSVETLLARWTGIDRRALDREKRAMLADIRGERGPDDVGEDVPLAGG